MTDNGRKLQKKVDKVLDEDRKDEPTINCTKTEYITLSKRNSPRIELIRYVNIKHRQNI